MMDRETKELVEKTLRHENREEVRAFYAVLPKPVLVGVGPVTALAFVLTLGPASRFARGKQVARYFGLIPSEASSGGRQRLGHISKQGSAFLRWVLVEAAQRAVRYEPELRRAYQRLAHRKGRALAKVAMARKLAVRLYWMLRGEMDYAQLLQGSCAGEPGSSRGRS
jgi:transposase